MNQSRHMPEPVPEPSRTSIFSPLRNPVFRFVWLASLASNFGGLIQSVGASWMMTSIDGTPQMIALVQASITLPIMLLSPIAGAIADNRDRRTLMITAQVFMLTVSVLLSACAWLGLITPWLLLLFTFLIGCGTALNGPAWQASVGDMVPRHDLPGAVALNSMGFNIARSVGPAVGGAIVATLGVAAAFAINALSYTGLIAVLWRWKGVKADRSLPREAVGAAIAAGIRYVAMSPTIRVVLARSLLFGVGASAIPSLMPLIARDLMGGGALTFGGLLGAFGLGAVAGALSTARLRHMLSLEQMVSRGCLASAVAAIVAGFSTSLAVTAPALFIAGAAWVLILSTFNVTVQLRSPRWVVARAISLYQMSAFGGMAVGSWLWGSVTENLGIETAFIAASVVMAICALAGVRLSLPSSGDVDLSPLWDWRAPETAVPVKYRSGPIVITIEYRIRVADRIEFLTAMAERRRRRRRDGARHWHLSLDLADPEVWMERFDLPTWLDYIRHNNRITQADVPAHDRIRALHQGSQPPIIRRMVERQTGSLPDSGVPTPHEMSDPLTDANRSS